MKLNQMALRIASKVIKMFESCNLTSYPDPGSELYKALSRNGMLQKYMKGETKYKDLPKNFQALSGIPWTIGWGSTTGIKPDMVWTQEKADSELEREVAEFMKGAIKISPKLENLPATKIAAVTSLCYNIGLGKEGMTGGYLTSTVARKIAEDDHLAAADAFLPWNKSKGKVMAGLVKRREIERNLYLAE